ncbi:insulin receptor [Anastrepha obliqua]|uniref:insulin receptor n=1 Tax=Anastrepha obliqua TaxID=95512 RepID=UPI002409290B|nr:insulin receptor [Anastrepha obliqua]
MENHLGLPATLQRGTFVLLLWAFILQAAIIQWGAPVVTAEVSANVVRPLTSDTPAEPASPPRTCKSIDVRKPKDLTLLRNCTRVMGHVALANLQFTPIDAETLQFNFPVEEITDYLLVHRVHGLHSLKLIFPNLKIIRGRQLLFDEFALVVHENRDLTDLGLKSLLRIQAGNIRIENNPTLCYVDTVSWVYLLGNSTQQHFWHKNNKLHNHCPLCVRTKDEIVEEENTPDKLHKHCWNYYTPQEWPPTYNYIGCVNECSVRGCNRDGVCCENNCLSSCNGTDCELCANLNLNRTCVDTCPQDYYQYQKRDCITASKCLQLGWIPYADSCVEACPRNHLKTIDAYGQPFCKLLCTGNYVINTASDAESLTGCITINGSLTIELKDIKTKISELEKAMVNITEITGSLKVVKSPQLLTLHFLRNLVTIRGEQLFEDLYAFYVVDNYHLKELWTPNQNVAVLNGNIYFHFNPQLCLSKIRELEPSLKKVGSITTINVSPHSNGERVICNSKVKTLNVTLEDKNSTAIRLKIDPYTSDNIQIILGYVYYYMEAPIQNVTLYDGRHGCGHDNWRMDINPTKNVRYIISNLKPYTQYAYFVKTLTMTDYHIQVDAYSKIQYVRTLPSKPGPVRRLYYSAIDIDKVVLHWWPPRIPNGAIEKYLIHHEQVFIKKQNISLGNHPDFLKHPTACECPIINPENSGPAPSDENYYSKVQLVYEETLPNLIFVARRLDNQRVRRDATVTTCMKGINCIDDVSPISPNNMMDFPESTDSHIRRTRKSSDNESKAADEKNTTIKDEHGLEGDPNFIEAIRNFNRYQKEMERRALRAQDTGPDMFPIIKPRSVCPLFDAPVEYQLQNNCRPQEQFDGIEVPGHLHSYTLEELEPNLTYRITIRACVADMMNGCGSETTIYAETVSKSMEEFIAGLKSMD